jgi:hypothetical protein
MKRIKRQNYGIMLSEKGFGKCHWEEKRKPGMDPRLYFYSYSYYLFPDRPPPPPERLAVFVVLLLACW